METRVTSERTPRGFEGQPRPMSLGIDQYFWVLRRQWRLISLVTVLGIIAAAAYLVVTPRQAIATTKLTLNVIMTDPFSSQRPASGLLDASTEAAIAGSHVVAERAAESLGPGITAADVRDSYTAGLSSSATVVTFTYTADSAQAAILGADTVAKAYLGFRQDQADARVKTIGESLTSEIDKLNKALDQTNETISSTQPDSSDYEHALAQQRQVLIEIEGLLTQRNALRAVDTTGGTVLSSAKDNVVAFEPSRSQTLVFGFAGGLVAGVLTAFIRNPRDRRFRTSREMSRILKAPVLTASNGIVPRESLEIAKQRLLTDFVGGTEILIFDTLDTNEVSPTADAVSSWFTSAEPPVTPVILNASSPADVIGALRTADAAVAIFDPTTSRTDTAKWFADEAGASGTPVLGIIEAPTRRRRNRSAA